MVDDRSFFSVDYIITILPIILSHVVLPPLSFIKGNEYPPEPISSILETIYSQIPKHWLTEKYYYSLLLIHDRNLWSKPFLEAGWLTSICVHGNYKHLFNNLFSAIMLSYSIHQNHGAVGLYCLYLLGGVVSGIPSSLTDGRKISFPMYPSHKLSDTWLSRSIRTVQESFQSFRKEFVNSIFPKAYMGSSGAVCALMGYHITHSVRLFSDLALKLFKLHTSTHTRFRSNNHVMKYIHVKSGILSRLQDNSLFHNMVVRMVHLAVEIFGDTMYLIQENENIARPKSLLGMDIGHGNHVQGILFGIATGIAVDWIVVPTFKFITK